MKNTHKNAKNVQNNYMEKIDMEKAVKIAYKNLYKSEIKKIDRNLDRLLKVKKIASLKASEEAEREM